MMCRRFGCFSAKSLLSRIPTRFVTSAVCVALTLFAPAALAQGMAARGVAAGRAAGSAPSHGGGFGERAGGGRVFGGAHNLGGWGPAESRGGIRAFSGPRPHTERRRASTAIGMSSYSGARVRSGSARTRFYGAAERGFPARNLPAGLREHAAPGRAGRVGASERGQHELTSRSNLGSPRLQHTTIGFPPGEGAWQLARSARRPGTTLGFEGQGHSEWQIQEQARGSLAAPERGLSARPPEELRPAQNRGDRGGRFGPGDHDRFHGRDHGHFARDGRFWRQYRGYRDGYGYYGFPFYGYGLGYFSPCDEWLGPDWYWLQGYDETCEDTEPPDNSIVAYGGDRSYGAPSEETQREYGPYAWQSSPDGTDGARGPAATEQGEWTGTASGRTALDTLIYLADGTNYAVTSYWLSGSKLHYLTSYGAEDAVPIGEVDLQRTVNANAARGVPFTLRPAPGSESGSAHQK